MNPHVLLIDDDARLTAMLGDYLRANGYAVGTAGSLAAGREQLQQQSWDALVLDLMLPDGDGLDLTRELRADSRWRRLPLLMLTARGEPLDRVVGLELGADDYLAKPFDPRELLARVRAVLRRRGTDAGPGIEVMRFGRLEIDKASRQVRRDGQDLGLTARQHDLLVAMAERAGRVLTRDQLIDLVGADGGETIDRSIDVHIAKIRAVIEDDPHHPRRIITVRGAGYVFAKAQD